jgi:hypothetical protein
MHRIKCTGVRDFSALSGGDFVLLLGQHLFPFGVRLFKSVYGYYFVLFDIIDPNLWHAATSCGALQAYYSRVVGLVCGRKSQRAQ